MIEDVLIGLQIFKDNGSKLMQSEHDRVYAGYDLPPDYFDSKVLKKLEYAGWQWEEEFNGWSIML